MVRELWFVVYRLYSVCLIRVSLCSSSIVLYRLFSSLLSYIKRRSRTLAFEKSFIARRPRGRSGEGAGLLRRDWVSLLMGLEVIRALRASMVWFWMRPVRFSRHERETMRSASMDSMGVVGVSSASIWSR